MSFDGPIKPAESSECASWIDLAANGKWWTVGWFVPTLYPAAIKVQAPEPTDEWWEEYNQLYKTISNVGNKYTNFPEVAYFGIWDGHHPPNPNTIASLTATPTLERKYRRYFLLKGPVEAASEIIYIGRHAEEWQRPELIWPHDREWFVATDVDFWSVYVAGSLDFLNAIRKSVPTDSHFVNYTDEVPIED